MCSFPKKKREGWCVVCLDECDDDITVVERSTNKQRVSIEIKDGVQRYRAETKPSFILSHNIDWDKVCKEFEKAYKEIATYKDEVRKRLDEVEMELCDCEHACEFFKYNAAKGYELYSMIRDRRIKRRYLKDEYRKAMTVLNMPFYEVMDGGLARVFKEVDEQSYEPRILKNLFQM